MGALLRFARQVTAGFGFFILKKRNTRVGVQHARHRICNMAAGINCQRPILFSLKGNIKRRQKIWQQ
jgi:hypothetical protein